MLGSHKVTKTLQLALAKSKSSRVYSTMYPAISPDFLTAEEVIEWFRLQPDWAKKKFTQIGYLTIYIHDIAMKDGLTQNGIEYQKGEVINTTEGPVFNFVNKQWIK